MAAIWLGVRDNPIDGARNAGDTHPVRGGRRNLSPTPLSQASAPADIFPPMAQPAYCGHVVLVSIPASHIWGCCFQMGQRGYCVCSPTQGSVRVTQKTKNWLVSGRLLESRGVCACVLSGYLFFPGNSRPQWLLVRAKQGGCLGRAAYPFVGEGLARWLGFACFSCPD